MSSKRACGDKLPFSSKRCTSHENFGGPARLHLPLPAFRDVTTVDSQGRTALHRVAERGDAGKVKDLLAKGFSPVLPDRNGLTPLLIALNERHISVAEVLIDAEFGLSIPDMNEYTRLHTAAIYGFDEIVKKLLFMNVHPHLPDDTGEYPVQQALSRHYFSTAKIILQMCAIKNIAIDFEEMYRPQNEILRCFGVLEWDRPRDETLRCVSILSDCYSEIERMKEAKIKGSNITFYQIATENAGKVAKYLENPNIYKILNLPFENFPNYADLLEFKVRKAKEKKVLDDQFVECFTFLARKWPYLPATCTDIISFYLSESDMRNVISAVKFFQ